MILLVLPGRASAQERPSRAIGPFEPDDAVAPAAPDSSKSPAPPAKPPAVAGLRVDGGYALRRVVGLPLTGGGVGVAVGAQLTQHAAVWGATNFFLGSTENGLRVRSGNLGMDMEGVIDRFRIGGGVHLFLIGVDRVTYDNTILGWGPGLSASARFDVIQSPGFTLFARATIEGGWEVNDASFWGPTFSAGVDFDLTNNRASMDAAR